MGEDWFIEYIKKIRREFENLLSEVERELYSPLIDYRTKTLQPLYEIADLGDKLIIRIDLPGVKDPSKVSIKGSENKLLVEAKMERPTSFEDLPTYACRSYNYYRVEITLPSPVDFKKSRAKLRRGVLEIELPKKIKYYKVKVE